jgi:uncharacterized membrane protein
MGAGLCRRIILLVTVLGGVFLMLGPVVPAQSYYADLRIAVDVSGFVTIQGQTDYPGLLAENTEVYTSKQQSMWLLNITKPEVFSAFVYSLTLPQGAVIRYVRSSGSVQIQDTAGVMVVHGAGENTSLSIVLQYQLQKQGSVLLDNLVYLVLLTLIVIVGVLLVVEYRKEKKPRQASSQPPTNTAPVIEWKGLNARQQEIMRLLTERTVPLTQTDIQRELQIPKASVSRNLRGLERKGLIEKEQIGMSNLIRVKRL